MSDSTEIPTSRRATIHDVAKLANASTAAVSRVLRNAYGVSDDMALRVRQAMETLDYRPNTSARGMRGRSYTIGVVHPDLRNNFFPDIISAIAQVVLPTGRELFYATTEWTSVEDVMAAMHDRQVEGVVVIAPPIKETSLVAAARRMPVVVTHRFRKSKHYDTIVSEDDLGVDAIIEHLVSLGHRSIAHLGPLTGKSTSISTSVPVRRVRAYREAMARRGLEAFSEVVDTPRYTFEDGYAASLEVLARENRPTAIFAATDNVAFGTMEAAHKLGLSIPKDFSLVGYDNVRMSSLSSISLTSVDQDASTIGTEAARLLMTRIAGRTDSVESRFSPRLVARGSTASPPR